MKKEKPDSLAMLQNYFEAAEDNTISARNESERARDYVDGKQLTAGEITELKKRGQPPVIINRIRRKVEWLLGLEVKQRTDPKAFPRTPQHQQDAEAVTDAIRFVCDNEDWDQKRSDAYDNMLVEGLGGVEVVHEMRGERVEVVVNQYPWDRLFFDPYSRRADFSDARYKGVVLWMDYEDFVNQFPDAKDHVSEMMGIDASTTGADGYSSGGNAQTYDDKPNHWMDAKRKRVRVVMIWFRENNEWHWWKFIKGHKLEGGKSPYVDGDGATVCPLIMQSAYVGRENERYGIVRDMFDPQDEVNKRRSKALHGINSRQTMGPKGAVDSVAEMKRQMAMPDGHIEYDAAYAQDGVKPFEVIQTADMTMGNLNLLQEAKQEIDLLGANSALEGETGENTSGRAVLARQQGGMIEIANLHDKLHLFTREVYRQIWLRIKQFWTEERWIRVTDDDRNARFVTINKQITLNEALGQMPQEQAIQAARELQLYPNDPRLQAVVGQQNVVAELDVDIVLEEVPDRVTLEGEMFEALMKYAQTGAIPPAVLIEADPGLPTKKKEKLLEMMQQTQPTPAEQLDMADKEAGVHVKRAQANKLNAEAMPLAGIA